MGAKAGATSEILKRKVIFIAVAVAVAVAVDFNLPI
jgi:hypothetical protein